MGARRDALESLKMKKKEKNAQILHTGQISSMMGNTIDKNSSHLDHTQKHAQD
jgi:hypothetical protein